MRPRRLVLIADVSGSMERYSRVLLASLKAAVGAAKKAEAFVFATRLTRLTRSLSGQDLENALSVMHETVRRLGNPDFYVTALVARWRAATSTFTWVNCGHPHAYVVGVDGDVAELEGPVHPPLGTGDAERTFAPTERRLASDERLILVTDGITERKTEGGGVFGIEGIQRAVAEVETPTAAATAMAILQGVTECWTEPLEDDGTVVVLCVA